MTYEKEIVGLRRRGVRVQVLRTFDQLRRVRDEFTVGYNGFKLPFLIIVGAHGTSKSHQFEKVERAKYVNNAASMVGLYVAVWGCRKPDADEDEPLILDDIDDLLTQKGATAFFKALGSDRRVKLMSWEKQNTWLESLGIPRQYETRSRICLLFNSFPKLSRDLQAVFDRAKICIFAPTAQEVHNYVGIWWCKENRDIYEYFGDALPRVVSPSIRWYLDALREKKLGNNWREWLLQAWYDENPELTVCAEIRTDKRFQTFNQQAAEFQRRTGLKRASYNLYLQKWKAAQGVADGKG